MGPGLIEKVASELDTRLRSAIVSKLHQPDERDVYLRVFVRGRQELLLISTNPKHPRIHLTTTRPEAPPAPKRFCAFLRSRITNAKIEKIAQLEGQRIVHIGLKKGPEAFTLVIELTGKSSNVILLDEKGNVLDALRHFPIKGSVRAVVPGLHLAPLPPAEVKEEGLVPKAEEKSWNEAAEDFYSGLVGKEEEQRLKTRLRRSIKEAEKRAKRKLENLMGDKKRAEESIERARLGELLTANFTKLKRGMTEVEVEDYFKATTPPTPIKIPLDPKLNPQENVDRFFKRARKARTTLKLLKTRIPGVERELEYIRGLVYEWEHAQEEEDLMEGLMEALFEELIEAGYLKEKPLTFRKAPVVTEPVRRFTSKEGFEIMAGKSGPGNDLLVKRYAKEGDIWFHAKGVPGSHVLLKAKGKRKRPTEGAIVEAASYAAWYSKNRASTKAEVIYTDAKNVRKPKGAKPGMVVVREYKSIVVRPKESAGKI
jgi:predicted ribosome quality control (RQC) complex YloA/Tae2 family protein